MKEETWLQVVSKVFSKNISQSRSFSKLLRQSKYIPHAKIQTERQNKRLPGAWIAHLDNFCLSRSNTTILTQEDFGRNYLRIILAIEIFFLSIIVFKILAENCKKKRHFSPFKGNNSYKESSDNFYPWGLVGLIIRIISATEWIWLNLMVLEIKYAKNYCLTLMFYL